MSAEVKHLNASDFSDDQLNRLAFARSRSNITTFAASTIAVKNRLYASANSV